VRALKWILGIVAGLILLALGLVVVVTVFVDPNRFKGRIEAAVHDASGLPFKISGDLDLAWYPWLAVRTGPAQLGDGPQPLVQWKAARVGARLIPLIRGRLVVSRVRLEGLQAHLRRTSDGQANWERLLASRDDSGKSSPAPLQFGGLAITQGSIDYVDERDGTHLGITDWMLEVDEWRPQRPFSLDTRFVLQIGAPSGVRIPIALEAPAIQMQSTPVSVSMPAFDLQLAGAHLEGSLDLQGLTPLRAGGALTVKSASLRKLLADLHIDGPRPRDPTTLGAFELSGQWAIRKGAVAVKPLQIQIDQTKLGGELIRSGGGVPTWRVNLRGDRIALDRYTNIETTDSEPFELPVEALQALQVEGELTFDEAQLAGAKLKNVRLRLEPPGGETHEP
jgi:AsmA protein